MGRRQTDAEKLWCESRRVFDGNISGRRWSWTTSHPRLLKHRALCCGAPEFDRCHRCEITPRYTMLYLRQQKTQVSKLKQRRGEATSSLKHDKQLPVPRMLVHIFGKRTSNWTKRHISAVWFGSVCCLFTLCLLLQRKQNDLMCWNILSYGLHFIVMCDWGEWVHHCLALHHFVWDLHVSLPVVKVRTAGSNRHRLHSLWTPTDGAVKRIWWFQTKLCFILIYETYRWSTHVCFHVAMVTI